MLCQKPVQVLTEKICLHKIRVTAVLSANLWSKMGQKVHYNLRFFKGFPKDSVEGKHWSHHWKKKMHNPGDNTSEMIRHGTYSYLTSRVLTCTTCKRTDGKFTQRVSL